MRLRDHMTPATAKLASPVIPDASRKPLTSIDNALRFQRSAGNQAMLNQRQVLRALEATSRLVGQPLGGEIRGTLEMHFGEDLSGVRIQTDVAAASAARSIGAKAFTVGNTIAFGPHQYRPDSPSGLRLLAHEIAHVLRRSGPAYSSTANWRVSQPGDAAEVAADCAAQQVGRGEAAHLAPSAGAGATVAREADDQGWMETADEWWGKKKVAAYDSLIDAIRSLKRSGLSELRELAQGLPAALQPLAQMLIEQVEISCDVVISLGLAIIGIVVGLVSGIAHAVWGLLSMLEGVLETLILFVAGFFDSAARDRFDAKANAFINGLKNLPANLRIVWDAWLAKFTVVSAERQTLMIGELTGQIEAVLLQLMVGGAAANAAPKLALAPAQQFAFATGRVAAAGGAAAVDLAGPGASALLSVNMANQLDNQAQATTKAKKKGAGPTEPPKPAPQNPPPKTSADVDKMWEELGEDLGNQEVTKHKGGVKGAMKDAGGFVKGDQPGEVNLETHAHKHASDVRAVKKLPGKKFQSAHAGASSWLNKRVWRNGKQININYSRGEAFTTLLPRDVHQSFDRLWKAFSVKARNSGLDRVPGSEMLRVMREAVAGSSVPGPQQGSLMMMIESELSELGLAMSDEIELPKLGKLNKAP